MSLLRQFFVHLDFDHNEVRFMQRKFAPPVGPLPPGENPALLYTLGDLPGGKEFFMFDTGSSDFGAIAPAKFDQLVQTGKMKLVGTNWIAATHGRRQVLEGELDVFTIAAQEHRDAIFARNDPSRLGYAFLTNNNWHLDFPRNRV